MKITTRREAFAERERSVTFRFTDRIMRGQRFCQDCQTDSHFVTVDEAATARQTTAREIYRLVENNYLHAADTPQGSLLVCLASLQTAAINSNQLTAGEK